ncbi:MAG: RidA family protein [Pseudomonadales bacterium]
MSKHIRWLLAMAAVTAIAACTATSNSPLQVLTTAEHESANLPFSEAVVAGDLIFLSGQIGAKPGSLNVVAGGIEAETRQALTNLQDVLERHGASMDQVAKCTVFMLDMAQWSAMNKVYVSFFPNHKPARSALAASGLAVGASVEIECIAARR